jgi:hypothetical protein
MVTIVKVKGFVEGLIKLLRFGKNDVLTAPQVVPAGIESKPLVQDNAIHSTTSNSNKSVVLGYTYEVDSLEGGEIRIYARNSAGNEVFSMYFKSDGVVEFGGNSDNLVKYTPLDSGLQAQKGQINTELTKIATAINAIVPGSYTPAPVSIDISNSKIDNIKV